VATGIRGCPPLETPRAGDRRWRRAPGGVHRQNPASRGSEAAEGARGSTVQNPSSRGAEVAPPETGGVYRSKISRAGARRWRRNPVVRCVSRTQKPAEPGQFARAPGHRDGGVADRARCRAAAANLAEPLAGVTTPRREARRANHGLREQRGKGKAAGCKLGHAAGGCNHSAARGWAGTLCHPELERAQRPREGRHSPGPRQRGHLGLATGKARGAGLT